jgi:hypothetical protein
LKFGAGDLKIARFCFFNKSYVFTRDYCKREFTPKGVTLNMSVTGNIKIFSGNAHPKLTVEICDHLGCDLGKASTERFSDGEFNFQIGENVRGSDVFIVQPTCPPTDSI